QNFKRVSLYQYQEKSQDIQLNDFFNQQPQISSTEFSGGLIGFIGYDYAAKQQITLQEKNQPSLFLGIYRSYLKLTAQGWTFFSDEEEAQQIFQVIEQA